MNKHLKHILNLSAIGLLLVIVSCGGDKQHSENSNSSKTSENSQVKIGDQIWMVANLNVDKFRNGDPIPQVEGDEAWFNAFLENKPAWCYYRNESENGDQYGKLYNWFAVKDPRGLAPKGWHIPSDSEWDKLIKQLGGVDSASVLMKSESGWKEDDGKNGGGTNKSHFTALPGGSRYIDGDFTLSKLGNIGTWWSTTASSKEDHAWSYELVYGIFRIKRPENYQGCGYSVRCIKD